MVEDGKIWLLVEYKSQESAREGALFSIFQAQINWHHMKSMLRYRLQTYISTGVSEKCLENRGLHGIIIYYKFISFILNLGLI